MKGENLYIVHKFICEIDVYMNDYQVNKKSKSLMYLDKNNMYG